MDIKKYIINKDLSITNDDIDIDRLTSDLRKGYESSNGVEKKIKSAVEEANKTSETKFNQLQSQYDEIEKRNTDLNNNIKKVSLERTMVENGFTKDQFNEISSLRYSDLYKDEADDEKAISQIKEKYKGTYFPETEKTPNVPNEPGLNSSNNDTKPTEIQVNRKTNIKDLFIKK